MKMPAKCASTLLFALFIFSPVPRSSANTLREDGPVFLIETMALSTDPTMLYGKGFPGSVTRTVSSKDKTLFYFAAVRVINPGKNKFELRLECVDATGQLIFDGTTTQEVHELTKSAYMGDKSGYIETSMGLNPAEGALLEGQRLPLENEQEYYIRLFVNRKLMGLTKFRYFIERKPAIRGRK